jgi:hypothetical protein
MLMDTHIGLVVANDTDPEKRFGIEVKVDTLSEDTYPELFYPIFPPNTAKVPEPNQLVEVVVMADVNDEQGAIDLGTAEFSDYCFYTGRIFDVQTGGKIPADLQTNYPKRAGLFWSEDDTIVFYDKTDGGKRFLISLTDRQTYFELKEDSIKIQQKNAVWEMKNDKIITTVTSTEMGAEGAAQNILLGSNVYDAFFTGVNALVTLWQAAASTLGSAPDPTGVAAQAYGTALNTALTTFGATAANWKSSKHKVDA